MTPIRCFCVIVGTFRNITYVAIQVKCRFCSQHNTVRKYGKDAANYQRFRFLDCKHTFQIDYTYEVSKPDVKDKIVEMAMNSSDGR